MNSRSDCSAQEGNQREVVVCTDLSDGSAALLQQAKVVSLQMGANLLVVHVLEMTDASELTVAGMPEYLAEVQARTQRLRSAAEHLHVPGYRVSHLLLAGAVVQRIRELVNELSPDLLIMGTTGRRGVERIFLGSTAEAIVRSVPCPVLTFGPNACAYANGPVVLPTDFNACATEDLAFALRLAESLRVRLHCVHFLTPKIYAAKNSIVKSLLENSLRKLASDAGATPGAVEAHVEPGSQLSRDIVEFARNCSASATVLGVMRRSALQSHLPAHETFKVLATARCPVYTINHSKDDPILSAVA